VLIVDCIHNNSEVSLENVFLMVVLIFGVKCLRCQNDSVIAIKGRIYTIKNKFSTFTGRFARTNIGKLQTIFLVQGMGDIFH